MTLMESSPVLQSSFSVLRLVRAEAARTLSEYRFLTTFPSLASILVLFVIAVDRYRKICKPLHPQIDLSQVRVAVIIIVVIAFVFSIPAILIYGHRTFPTPVSDLYGYDCSVDDAFKDKPYPLVYEGIFLVAFFVFALLLVCIYLRIWLETRRHFRYLKTHATFGTGMVEETTTSSWNCEDSFLENGADDAATSASRRSTQKSLHKKSSRSRRKTKSSSKRGTKQGMLPEGHLSVSFTGGGVSAETEYDQGRPVTYKYTSSEKMEAIDNHGAYITSGHFSKEKVIEETREAARALLSSLSNEGAPGQRSDPEETREAARALLSSLSNEGAPRQRSDPEETREAARALLSSLSNEGAPGHRSDLDDGVEASRTLSRAMTLTSPDTSDVDIASGDHPEASDVNNSNHPIRSDTSVSSSARDDVTHKSKRRASHPDQPRDNMTWVSCDRRRSSRTSSRKLGSHNGDLHLSGSGVSCPPQTADGSNQHVDDKKINNHCRHQNGTENNSYIPSISEHEIKIGSNHHDSKLNGTACPNFVEDTSQRINKCPEHCTHQTGQLKPKEETSLLPKTPSKQSITHQKKTSFFSQSEIRFDTADAKTDQSQRVSISNQTGGSSYRKSSQSVNPSKQARKALRSRRMTVIAFAITAGFILSYLPHLTLIILRSLKTDFEHRLDDVSLVFYNIFLRSYFVNNVVNVFVYGTINVQFRSEVIGVWRRIKCANS